MPFLVSASRCGFSDAPTVKDLAGKDRQTLAGQMNTESEKDDREEFDL